MDGDGQILNITYFSQNANTFLPLSKQPVLFQPISGQDEVLIHQGRSSSSFFFLVVHFRLAA